MSVNENYYGLKENWFPLGGASGWQSSIPDDEKFKIANFLNNTQAALQSDVRNGAVLGNAIYKAYKTDSVYYDPSFEAALMGKVFDESIEFAGMSGLYCPYSTIVYYSNRREQDQGSVREIVNEGEDHINIWNYFFTTYMTAITQGYGNLTKRWSDFYVSAPSSPSGTYGYEFTAMRWMPCNPQDSPIQIGTASSSYPYYYTNYATRNQITFITQFPCRRAVLVPTVTCSDDALNPTNVRTYDLYTYLNVYKETHPIVWSIQVEIYTKAGASDSPTSTDRRVLRNTMIMASNTSLSLSFRSGSPYVQTMAAGGSLVNEDNPFMVPQILPTGSICTPIGGPINVGLGASSNASGLWQISGGNSYQSFSVWAIINCGALEFNNWTSHTLGGNIPCRCYCNAADYTKSEFREAVRHAVACFGMFFTDSETYAETAQLDDDTMHLGVLVEGVGYGEYTSGENNTEQPQFGWKTMNESPYDPSKPPTPPDPPDPNVYDTASQLNTPSKCASGTKYYVLNAAAVENLVGELWKAQDSIPPDTSYMDFNNEQYLSNNPIDMIVSCKRYPLAPLKASDSEALVLGQYQTNVQGYELSDTTSWINLGSKLIYRHFKNYLDYQTKITLYIPFCGMINLDPSVWMGQTVIVYMSVDYITGSCTAYLIRDSDKVIYATAEGNCSVDLPITGLQAATIEAQLMRSRSSLDSSKLMIGAKIIGGAAAFAVAAASGGTGAAAAPAVIGGVTTIASTISDAYKINQLNYDLHHTDAPVQQIGSSSPLNAWSGELECRLYVYYPAVDPDVDNVAYAHSIGNATVQQGTIGSFGSAGEYAVITNADLSDINCTDSEKTMISNALTSGVYL